MSRIHSSVLAVIVTLYANSLYADEPKNFSVGVMGGPGYITMLGNLAYSFGAEFSYLVIPHIEVGAMGRYDIWSVAQASATAVILVADLRWRPSDDRGFWIGGDLGYGFGRVSGGSVSASLGGLDYEISLGYDFPLDSSFSLGVQADLVPPAYFLGLVNLKYWF